MSNGVPVSGSSYIIICSIRTEIDHASDPQGKVVATSKGAAQFSAFMELRYKLRAEDLKEISDLQHEMMNELHSYDLDGANLVCQEMVRLMYVLEKKFSGRQDYQ